MDSITDIDDNGYRRVSPRDEIVVFHQATHALYDTRLEPANARLALLAALARL